MALPRAARERWETANLFEKIHLLLADVRRVVTIAVAFVIAIAVVVTAFEIDNRQPASRATKPVGVAISTNELQIGVSMQPTIQPGDELLVNRRAYAASEPTIGDIVVFSEPSASICGDPSGKDLVKRVVAVPGDQVSSKGNALYVNGKTLMLPHVDPLLIPIPPQTIPPSRYFVMGDNYSRSCDSRAFGTVPITNIRGKVTSIRKPVRADARAPLA